MNGTILPQISGEILSRMSKMAIPPELNLSIDENGGFSIASTGE